MSRAVLLNNDVFGLPFFRIWVMNASLRLVVVAYVFALSIIGIAAECFSEGFTIQKGGEVVLADGGLPLFYDFEINAAIKGNRNVAGVGNASWGVSWRDKRGVEIMRVALQWGNDYLGDPFDRRFLRISAGSISTDGEFHQILSRDFYENVGLFEDNNCLTAECDGEHIRLWVGSGAQCYAGEVSVASDAHSVVMWSNRKLNVDFMAYRSEINPADALITGAVIEDVEEYLRDSHDLVEGFWCFLDRDTDTRWADIGGNYKLAIVKHGLFTSIDSGVSSNGQRPIYDILLMGGAVVNGKRWNNGMVKGYLYGTIFENHYNLEWFDSMMESMGGEVSADITDGVILALNFPIYHATMRFSKEP